MNSWRDEAVIPTRQGERRLRRSSDPIVALTHMLDAARDSGRLEALAVSDPAGCLVAGSGAALLCDELAALAPLALEPANDVLGTVVPLAGRVESRRVVCDGVEVLVCAYGESAARAEVLRWAAAGCQRILRETAG